MKWLSLIVDGAKALRDIVLGVRDARRANVKDALGGYASGRSAHDAAAQAGKKPNARTPDVLN
jgi:hypothetical protein